MDTGAITIKITTDANLPITQTQEVMEQINKLMYDHDREKLLRASGSIGSEAGVMSIGSGSGIDHILIMATYVNRHEREETIWDISNYLRAEIAKIPLSKIASLDSNKEPSTITRDGLNYTLEIYGNREKGAISHIMAKLEEQLQKVTINCCFQELLSITLSCSFTLH